MTDYEMTVTKSETLSEPPPTPVVVTRGRKILGIVGWVVFGLACLIFFTLMKLPTERVKAYVDGAISSALADHDMSFSSGEADLSILFGVSYEMKDITIIPPAPARKIHIDRVKISPSILSYLFSLFNTYSGHIVLENEGGSLGGKFSLNKTSDLSLSFEAKKLNIGKLGLITMLQQMQGTAIVSGKGEVEMNSSVASSLSGNVNLQVSGFNLDSQTLAGFNLPKIEISEAVLDASADRGKVSIKNLRLGKPTEASRDSNQIDDIQGTITGAIGFSGPAWQNGLLDLKAQFSLSEKILKSFVLLDALLNAGKRPGGGYGFAINGTLSAPIPSPMPAGGP